MILKVWNWIVYSSSRTEYYSATIKGTVVFIPSVVVALSLINVHIDPTTMQALIVAVATVVGLLGTFISAIYTVFGIVRKIILTVQGKNDAVINPEARSDQY